MKSPTPDSHPFHPRHAKELLGAISRLAQTREGINLWSLLENFKENSYSNLLAFLLDSTREHRLGNTFCRAWIGAVQKKYSLILTRRSLYQSRAYVEWPAGNQRRLDVLIKGYSHSGKELLFVIGVENKIHAVESNAQLSDYQAALGRQFPRAAVLVLFFLTPDGRSGLTSDATAACRCLSVPYATLSRACSTVKPRNRTAAILVKHLAEYIEGEMFGGKMKESTQVKQIVSSKPEFKEAAYKIRRYDTPITIRNIMYEEVLCKLRDSVVQVTGISWHYPDDSSRPNEFNFLSRTTNKVKIQGHSHTIYYMLYSATEQPDIGDAFTVHVRMEIDGNVSAKIKAAAKRYRDKLSSKLPPSKMPSRDGKKWVCLWTGGHHQLVDLGKGDAASLAELVIDAYENTKLAICKPK